MPDVRGQDIILTGKIIDATTSEPIPFCNILVRPINKGTFSNEEGEFLFKIDSLPVTLVVSNIAYKQKSVQVTGPGEVVLLLEPASTVLEEIVVKEKKMDRFAHDLVKKALEKTRRSSIISHYGKAFYRQKSKNDSSYVELMEIFYDVRFSSNGILDWEVQEGRYAQHDEQLLNRNFTLLSRIFPTMHPETNDLYLPLSDENHSIFDIYLADIIEVDGSKIGIVSFVPKKGIVKPCFSGDLYIDINTHDVLKIDGSFTNDDLPIIKFTEKKGDLENLVIKYETAFKRDSLGNLLLDYVKMNQQFDYYIDGIFRYPVHSQSFLTFYEYYKPLRKNKKLGGRLKYRNNDRDILDLVGYNPKFWQDNPVVKRTPVEDTVINSFEKDEAFGTIYLNSKEQIALSESEIGNELFLKDLLLKVKSYQYNSPVEKVYLQFDKPYYAAGQNMWFSAYVVDANGLYLKSMSRVLHVELIDPQGQIVESQKIKLLGGRGTGQLLIPNDVNSGTCFVRAYTQWMRNDERDFYFNKKINVYNPKEELLGDVKPPKLADPDKIDLQFFPEGGHAINGIPIQMAYKGVGTDGKGREVEGSIIDETGEVRAFFKSTYKGMGLFYFKPEKGHQYRAQLNGSGITYDLPEALDEGYTLMVRNSNQKSVKVRIQVSEGLENAPVYLIGQSRNNVYFRQKYSMESGMVSLEIPKNQLPSGIFTLTLFDIEKKPRAERVVFINREAEFNIDFQVEKTPLEKQDLVKLNILTQDEEGRPVPAGISLAVTDVNQVQRDENDGHILSQLLLESDLRGFIETPGYFFSDMTRTKNYSLDLIMMTHGWRKFRWLDVLKKGALDNHWAPEKGISLKGVVTDPLTNKPIMESGVILLSINEKSNFSVISKTDQFGIFNIKDLSFNVHDDLIFKVINEDGKVIPANVVWEQEKRPFVRFSGSPVSADKKIKKMLANELVRQQAGETVDAEYVLEEVTIEAGRLGGRDFGSPNAVVVRPEKTNGLYTNILQMIEQNVSGVRIFGYGVNSRISINGRGTPLIIVNGLELNSRTAGQPINTATNPTARRPNNTVGLLQGNNNSDVVINDLINWVQPDDVEKVEVLRHFNAAAYGAQGRNGVIIIHTKKGEANGRSKLPDRHAVYIQEKGFEPVKTFYQPKYEVDATAKSNVDHPPLIYWLPLIATDRNGKATVSFYLPKDTPIQMVAEGISDYGKPGMAFEVYRSK
ncbi:carboxypeptidase-like regulatory domain-containing protein [Fulvivirgaceae bacterium BMA12]|uniref:Carboxypeptidase-like regulatory domain-containing protein n=1 Tax=Agaribacillus aureus TaxID=3051825 RepID=A0ABT8LFT3_9BACT|nr:carboxypeptidase-like regulatory domain-containing protein [Fulvivirgaceae bacterium BMA12]